ncbi:MAG: C40 family peptidase, partial [Clostridia bacterium]|nr:C40 family peptidase [Clostridia bacterium]
TATPTPKPTNTPTPAPTPVPSDFPTTGVEGFIALLQAQLGKPYVLGGNGPSCFDCSGLIYYCLRQMGINIGRLTAAGYANYDGWTMVPTYTELQRGDLIFYYNDSHSYISHVAVYLGNNTYIHASSSQGMIVISDFGSWSISHFAWGRRVFD